MNSRSFQPVAMRSLSVLSIAAVVFLAGCKPPDKDAADAKDPKAVETAKEDGSLKIAGLPTLKEQASYMIGMRMAKQMEPIKDEVSVDTLARGIKDAIAGNKPLMTEEQASQVEVAFGEHMRAKQVAEMTAKAAKNAEAGPKFLAENAKKPGIKTTESGIQYQVITEGKGEKPKATDVVKVHYKGTELDGKVFDSSYDRGEPAMMPLGQVVPGWREGVQLMPVGSKYKLWIPSKLGYGETPPPGAPFGPNATLVFEVELLEIVDPSKQPPMPGMPEMPAAEAQ